MFVCVCVCVCPRVMHTRAHVKREERSTDTPIRLARSSMQAENARDTELSCPCLENVAGPCENEASQCFNAGRLKPWLADKTKVAYLPCTLHEQTKPAVVPMMEKWTSVCVKASEFVAAAATATSMRVERPTADADAQRQAHPATNHYRQGN